MWTTQSKAFCNSEGGSVREVKKNLAIKGKNALKIKMDFIQNPEKHIQKSQVLSDAFKSVNIISFLPLI